MLLIIAVGGRTSVHICPRRPADWDVPIQVQADEADSHVQGPETHHLLPIQHRESNATCDMSIIGLITLYMHMQYNVNNKFIECTGTRVSSALGCHLQYCANRNVFN